MQISTTSTKTKKNPNLEESPFGSLLPGRNYSSSSYKFDFNGKETDGEWGLQDYGMRIYDKRLCRFISVDPIARKFPMLSSYQYASNSPIQNIDLDGLEGVRPIGLFSISFSHSAIKKANYLSIGPSLGLIGNGFEANLKYNYNLTVTTDENGQSTLKGSHSYSGSVMFGKGNSDNYVGFATTGFSSGNDYSVPDFSPSVGSHIIYSPQPGNNFIGGGMDIEGDFNKSTPTTFSIIGRAGFGVKSSDTYVPSSSSTIYDFDRKTTEFSVNGSFTLNTLSLHLEGSSFMSNSEFRSSGSFLNPTSNVDITGKKSFSVGTTFSFDNKLKLAGFNARASYSGKNRSVFGTSGSYTSGSGASGSVGGAASSSSNTLTQ